MDTTDTAAANTEDLDRADMARLAAGHDAALADLMDRHATPIFRFLCRALGHEDDARDLAQETFVRVFKHRASFRPDARFTTWLYTIAGNLARNHHRWRSRHPTISLDAAPPDTERAGAKALLASDPSPSEALSRDERSSAVRAAVDALPDHLREAIILCEWQELAIADAAAVLNTTPKAVETRLYRARHVLRDNLRKWL